MRNLIYIYIGLLVTHNLMLAEHEGWYSKVAGGYFLSSEDEYWVGSLGYDFDNDWRVSVEIGYSTTEFELLGFDSKGTSIPLFLNAEHVWYLGDRWEVLAGAGIGAIWFEAEADLGVFGRFEEAEWTWAGQAYTGLGYELFEGVNIEATVRWMRSAAFDLSGIEIEESDDLAVTLGVRFEF